MLHHIQRNVLRYWFKLWRKNGSR